MRWRSIVLAALAIVFGVTAGVFIDVETRLYAALSAIYAPSGSGPTAAQSESAAAMTAQVAAVYPFTGPLVVGFLLCVVGLLVVLAWRWQASRRDAQN